MGGCLTLDREEALARRRSQQIDKQLAELASQEGNVIKILLLGAGESGKSTLVKQMKIIHSDGFTRDELLSFAPTIRDNLLSSMKYVLAGMGLLRINLQSARNKGHAQTVLSSYTCMDKSLVMIATVCNALHALWQDRGVRLAVARGYEYELNDSAIYLFENMDRICGEKYVPSPTDVLRARIRTHGVIETHFKINDAIIRMFDVGGQRSQRRKWIYCFDDVKAVLFVVSLSGYDMSLVRDITSLSRVVREAAVRARLLTARKRQSVPAWTAAASFTMLLSEEDQVVNRLEESLTLFLQIVNNRFFKDAAFLLFLNKLDLFREKILYSGRHLRLYFPEFKGPDCDVDRAALFIQHKFALCNTSCPERPVSTHFLTATDTANVQAVVQVVMDSVLRHNTRQVTLL